MERSRAPGAGDRAPQKVAQLLQGAVRKPFLASLTDAPFEHPEPLFATAGEALQAAKRGGRDQLGVTRASVAAGAAVMYSRQVNRPDRALCCGRGPGLY